MITIKSAEEQAIMRQGGKILAAILGSLKEAVKPGVLKSDIDKLAENLCAKYNVRPSFKGYNGYPASVCISVNDEVVHGVPNEEAFNDGDLVSLDMGVEYKGFHTDSALSLVCGGEKDSKDFEQKDELIKVAEQSFYSAIDVIKNGAYLGDVSARIQEVVESHGCGVIRMLVGHGIGRSVHEDPNVPNYGSKGTGIVLKTGMTIAIEPMITADASVDVVLDSDGWTYKSKTGALCAHYEHTVLVTDDGCEVLTLA